MEISTPERPSPARPSPMPEFYPTPRSLDRIKEVDEDAEEEAVTIQVPSQPNFHSPEVTEEFHTVQMSSQPMGDVYSSQHSMCMSSQPSNNSWTSAPVSSQMPSEEFSTVQMSSQPSTVIEDEPSTVQMSSQPSNTDEFTADVTVQAAYSRPTPSPGKWFISCLLTMPLKHSKLLVTANNLYG